MKEELWTVEEVAKRWRVSPRTIRDMLTRGEISGIKIRMNWRILLTEVMRYETEQVPREHKRETVAPQPRPVVTRIS